MSRRYNERRGAELDSADGNHMMSLSKLFQVESVHCDFHHKKVHSHSTHCLEFAPIMWPKAEGVKL